MISSGVREIGDERFRLREVTRRDAEDLYRWRMDPASRPMFHEIDEVSFEAHQRFIDRYLTPTCSDRWFIIEAEGRSAGAIALYGLSADGSEAEWGRLVVDPSMRGKGYGRQALRLLIEHARELGVRRLRCDVLRGNLAAEKIYATAGFREIRTELHSGREFRVLELSLGDPARESSP